MGDGCSLNTNDSLISATDAVCLTMVKRNVVRARHGRRMGRKEMHSMGCG